MICHVIGHVVFRLYYRFEKDPGVSSSLMAPITTLVKIPCNKS